MQQLQPITLLLPEIKELLKEKNYTLLKQILRDCNPIGFADSWYKLTEEEKLEIFRLLPSAAALRLFKILDVDDQRHLLEKLNEENMTPLLTDTDSPNIAKIFHKMPPRTVNRMKTFMKRQEALEHVNLLMKFPKNSAGSLMHPEFIKLSPKLTAKQAIARLQAVARPHHKEHLYALFVTDDDGKVIGSVELQDLLAASEDEKLSELMNSVEGFKVKAPMDQEEVSSLFSKYKLNSVPVVDDEGRLIGILTLKDMVSIVQQETTEDMAKMVGTRALDLKESSVLRTVKYRTPWLIVTLIGELLVSFIIKSFEPILAKVIALAAFSPLISAMGGNVGSQSATIVVRSIALGEIQSVGEKFKTIVHEAKVGVLMGLFYGLLLGGIAYGLYGTRYHWQFALSVAIAMWTSVTVACTMGAVEPIFFDRIGIDPATATGPLITTITDIFTNFTYYTLATLLLLHLTIPGPVQ